MEPPVKKKNRQKRRKYLPAVSTFEESQEGSSPVKNRKFRAFRKSGGVDEKWNNSTSKESKVRSHWVGLDPMGGGLSILSGIYRDWNHGVPGRTHGTMEQQSSF